MFVAMVLLSHPHLSGFFASLREPGDQDFLQGLISFNKRNQSCQSSRTQQLRFQESFYRAALEAPQISAQA